MAKDPKEIHRSRELKHLSKFMSLILRHKPETIGISLDPHGYADVDELLKGMNKHGSTIDFETLEEIVKTDNKQRYSFNSDKSKIRANQGHSIEVNVDLEELQPPNVLYHGTGEKSVQSIKEQGIKKMGRLYVHLSKDYETAIKVGSRHGKPVVFQIDTKQMYQDGYQFFLSKNKIWLTKKVPTKYIKII